ncbi:HAL/PAL/TAL family ammonia-lyase [Campylobacter pinnipediorum]|uniref:Sugar transporter n=1 Tax=Campylobacter pinnipediorum subsp. pinnipediorum TaxID=1660067 RepID=A0AAX0LC98_9BACT|nr:aromatic amino acid ammonia-lyase [Campylobacter pinnipediorum]AQW81440.1 phenylalanine/histidine ammonia-lyase [Campylobacter pinnipediorum subsp. pinnipediorum]AQW83068.1 phenylalanine/histidine ammonia-lyase [Campylobacter pinnipediorum subsp. pinnipediorum]AQW84636.1 phenylalanine/histidine ammonia-lyase [Campylobacter pinnipediorum subsp. pinnipediorum]OPA81890.1 sugar transporter [Campylobacter pinnipediorum subsp. pinnipediorum]
MRSFRFLSLAAVLALGLNAQSILLNGNSVTPKDIVLISNGAKVEIGKDALTKVNKAHDVLLEAAKDGQKIYGLTVGVGLNKDKKFVDAKGNLDKEVIDASTKFNIGLIHAHCGGVGEDMPLKTARAVLATRLNNMLYAGAGVQSDVVNLYKEFLNKDIIPVMPSKGSMGEADITILGHVGLAMLGEGDVYYKGKKMPASEALKKAGLKKLSPFGKDSLSILSSNAYSAALASIAVEDLKHTLELSKLVFALSLEAFNGNVAPFTKEASELRAFPDFISTTKEIREILKDSYLWDQDNERALQDPLSYRDASYFFATLKGTINTLENLMKIQLNTSDDNPGISLSMNPETDKFQETKLFTKNGAVVPTSNFEPIMWVVEFEKASIVLAHNSKASALRTIKLSNDGFTHLSRFLGTDKTVHAFGAMQKPFVALAGENEYLANPISLDYTPVAGEIEDVATNAPFVVQKLQKQINNYYHILGMELMHAAQAIDLRKQKNPDLKLSKQTEKLYNEYRKVVKFMDIDRPLTDDFRNSAKFLKEYK